MLARFCLTGKSIMVEIHRCILIDAGKSLANGSYLLGFTKPDNPKR